MSRSFTHGDRNCSVSLHLEKNDIAFVKLSYQMRNQRIYIFPWNKGLLKYWSIRGIWIKDLSSEHGYPYLRLLLTDLEYDSKNQNYSFELYQKGAFCISSVSFEFDK